MSTKFNEVSVPDSPPERPTAFLVVQGGWGSSGDVAGLLMHADGSVAWTHISSSMGWLRRDLTTGFPDRTHDLAERYGDEADLAIVYGWSNAPGWLRERNEAWLEQQEAET